MTDCAQTRSASAYSEHSVPRAHSSSDVHTVAMAPEAASAQSRVAKHAASTVSSVDAEQRLGSKGGAEDLLSHTLALWTLGAAHGREKSRRHLRVAALKRQGVRPTRFETHSCGGLSSNRLHLLSFWMSRRSVSFAHGLMPVSRSEKRAGD